MKVLSSEYFKEYQNGRGGGGANIYNFKIKICYTGIHVHTGTYDVDPRTNIFVYMPNAAYIKLIS